MYYQILLSLLIGASLVVVAVDTHRRRSQRHRPEARNGRWQFRAAYYFLAGSLTACFFWGWLRGPLYTVANPAQRVIIVRELAARKGASSGRYLIGAMREDKDARVRAAAACAIGELSLINGVEPLIERATLRGEALDVRICALQSLKLIRSRSCLPALIHSLGNARGSLRIEIVNTIGVFQDPIALPALVRLLNTPISREESEAASRAIGEIGPLGLDAANEMFKNGKKHVAIDIMRYAGPSATRALFAACRDASRDVQVSATRAILLSNSPGSANNLVELLQTDLNLVAAAHRDLIELGDETFLSLLIRSLKTVGNVEMAKTFLNCGQSQLEEAAKSWAQHHGYTISTGFGSSGARWGRR